MRMHFFKCYYRNHCSLSLAVLLFAPSSGFLTRGYGISSCVLKAGQYACSSAADTQRIIALRRKDLLPNNIKSYETLAAARFIVSFSQLYVALYPLVKSGLIFSVNHYVTHETFVCGNSQLLTILEVKNILTNT